ncbi:hypothetical protein [Nonomuraea rubra]|uniref:hypothetical protein n=1 Tax=Nonomuraea rubra TaxID=46180 RepID=UPI0031E4FC89
MQASEVQRAVSAARSVASSLGLPADDAVVLQDSNKLTLRLLPCDVLARVSPAAHQVAQFEVRLAQQLAGSGCPVAVLEPRVEPRVYGRDGFEVTLWTYYEPVAPGEISPAGYADALKRLHAGMRAVEVPTPHFTDRAAEAEALVASRERSPALADADRELLGDTLRRLRAVIGARGAPRAGAARRAAPGGTCSPRRTGCCSSTSRRAAAGRSNSTSPMRPKRSASTIRMPIRTCCASAGLSCWR